MFEEILSDFNPKTKDCQALLPVLNNLFTKFQDNFQDILDSKLKDMRREFLEILKSKDEKVSALEIQVATLKSDLNKLDDKIQDQDSYERRDTVILSGKLIPAESNMENCAVIASNLAKEHLSVIFSPSDVSVAHRLTGNSRGSGNANKSIIIKFCRRDIKTDLLAASRRSKPRDLFVNESLTPQRQTISYVLRKAKQQFPLIISGSTSFDGKPHVWVKPPNPQAQGAKDSRYVITTYARLVDFCNKVLERPLTHFIKEWTH